MREITIQGHSRSSVVVPSTRHNIWVPIHSKLTYLTSTVLEISRIVCISRWTCLVQVAQLWHRESARARRFQGGRSLWVEAKFLVERLRFAPIYLWTVRGDSYTTTLPLKFSHTQRNFVADFIRLELKCIF